MPAFALHITFEVDGILFSFNPTTEKTKREIVVVDGTRDYQKLFVLIATAASQLAQV